MGTADEQLNNGATETPDSLEEKSAQLTLAEDGGDEDGDGAADASDKSKKDKKKERQRQKAKEEKAKLAAKKTKDGAAKESGISKRIKEEQALIREAEEKARLAAEEEETRLVAAETAQKEAARVEEERKLAKKQRDKERKERQRAEGKLLTEKQKRDKAKLEQMLAASGGLLPISTDNEDGNAKPVRYGARKRGIKKQEVEKSPSPPPEEVPVYESPAEEAESSEEDWEAAAEKPEKVAPVQQAVAPTPVVAETTEELGPAAEEESESSEDEDDNQVEPVALRLRTRRERLLKKRNSQRLRCPIICVLGHVDTGKTSLLDKLRRTHVQAGEAGGITQQIGATNVPQENLVNACTMVKEFARNPLRLPGLLIIDTPGHESFSNLRSRGSNLCDIAILVVDLMHGLEPQTIESIKMLQARETPFLVALNKVDRLFGWKTNPTADVFATVRKQSKNVQDEFQDRVNHITVQFAQQLLNVKLYNENPDHSEYVSMVPTSAHTGDGIGTLLGHICLYCQDRLEERVTYCQDLEATVMEVKAISGLGTTVDIALVNGKLKVGSTVVLAGTEGPIITQIRGLITPQPMKELRVKGQYIHHNTIHGATGVKLLAKDMEKALAGLPLFVSRYPDEVPYLEAEQTKLLATVLRQIKISDKGVYVQASTLGSLEALLEFLRTSNIPYSGINIGPVHKKDVMKVSAMLEHDVQFAVILAFDVRIEAEAKSLADNLGVKVFEADIIYHLFDKFMKFREEYKKKKQDEFKHVAVFPCKLRIMPEYIFNARDPIIVGVRVERGFVKEGTPICVPSKDFCALGRVASIEKDHKHVHVARIGDEVCIRIDNTTGDAPKLYGRHFEAEDMLMSHITRNSIDVVKEWFREEMSKPDWQLVIEMKKTFDIN